MDMAKEEDALDVAEEAVRFCRDGFATVPKSFAKSLIRALFKLSNVLSALERAEEASVLSQEVAALSREYMGAGDAT